MQINSKNIVYIGILIFFILGFNSKVYASEIELEQRIDRNKYLYDINAFRFKVTNWTSKGDEIVSYDISKENHIVITFFSDKIGVFDENMDFLYELTYKSRGASGAIWYGENVLFIDCRSDTAIEFNSKGLPINVYTITGPTNYFIDIVEKNTRKQSDCKYYCVNEYTKIMNLGFYSTLKRVLNDGTEEILYKSDGVISKAMYIVYVAFVIAVILVIKNKRTKMQ